MKKLTVLLLLAALLGGCATTRAWDKPSTAVLQKIEKDDRVTLVATNGKTYRMRVTGVTEDTLYGVGREKQYVVAFRLIDSIEVERDHPVAAGFTVFGVSVTVGIVAVVVAALENMSDQNWDFCGGN